MTVEEKELFDQLRDVFELVAKMKKIEFVLGMDAMNDTEKIILINDIING